MLKGVGFNGLLQQPQEQIGACGWVGLPAAAGGHLPGVGLLSELAT